MDSNNLTPIRAAILSIAMFTSSCYTVKQKGPTTETSFVLSSQIDQSAKAEYSIVLSDDHGTMKGKLFGNMVRYRSDNKQIDSKSQEYEIRWNRETAQGCGYYATAVLLIALTSGSIAAPWAAACHAIGILELPTLPFRGAAVMESETTVRNENTVESSEPIPVTELDGFKLRLCDRDFVFKGESIQFSAKVTPVKITPFSECRAFLQDASGKKVNMQITIEGEPWDSEVEDGFWIEPDWADRKGFLVLRKKDVKNFYPFRNSITD